MSEIFGAVVVIAWFVSAAVGALIGMQKGKAGKGALLGFLLGPLGWVLMMADAGVFTIGVLLCILVGVVVAGIQASERERDRMQQLEIEATQKQREMEIKQASEQATASVVKEQEVVVAPESVPVVSQSELVVIRGNVRESACGVMIVDCDEDRVPQGFAWNVDAGAGAAESAALARQAMGSVKNDVLKEYGVLTMVGDDGRVVMSDFHPTARPLGTFALTGYPGHQGRVHIVAASTGQKYSGLPVYSAKFEIAGASQSPVSQRSIFPAGVDTPEERRAYLQDLAAAKKSAGPVAPRRVTDRGY